MGKIFVVLCALFLLMLAPIVLADTEINVRTYAEQRVSIFIYNPGEPAIVESYHIDSDINGLASATYTGSQPEIDVKVKISENGDDVIIEDFEEMSANEPLYLQVKIGEVSDNYLELDKKAEEKAAEEAAKAEQEAVVENETAVVEEVDVVAEDVDSGDAAGVTGLSVFDGVKRMAGIFYFVIVLVVIMVVLLVVRGVMKRRSFKRSNVSPALMSVKGKPVSERIVSDEEEIRLIEQKIKEAKIELAKIGNKSRIKEAEDRIRKDQEDLEKLKSGELG